MNRDKQILLDAGLFIGALLKGDARHQEARTIIEAARQGELTTCTTTSILSEVYAALTWINAQPPHSPSDAANAVRLLIELPSAIDILSDGFDVSLKMLELSEKYNLTARKVHDARHAATAIINDIELIYTYDITDWRLFEPEGLIIAGPPSVMVNINKKNE
ncbi:type II toxin-antitoxin system VapC family toxin [candidate division KSB1 bacterium]|nr:type II toxin-antitoxin system VapC family toxin [candidate division KSB1 bacterium]MBL7092966.1 type II toxin-antitoxin system VapC family toxin [candidate division KSB1 bacterium]